MVLHNSSISDGLWQVEAANRPTKHSRDRGPSPCWSSLTDRAEPSRVAAQRSVAAIARTARAILGSAEAQRSEPCAQAIDPRIARGPVAARLITTSAHADRTEPSHRAEDPGIAGRPAATDGVALSATAETAPHFVHAQRARRARSSRTTALVARAAGLACPRTVAERPGLARRRAGAAGLPAPTAGDTPVGRAQCSGDAHRAGATRLARSAAVDDARPRTTGPRLTKVSIAAALGRSAARGARSVDANSVRDAGDRACAARLAAPSAPHHHSTVDRRVDPAVSNVARVARVRGVARVRRGITQQRRRNARDRHAITEITTGPSRELTQLLLRTDRRSPHPRALIGIGAARARRGKKHTNSTCFAGRKLKRQVATQRQSARRERHEQTGARVVALPTRRHDAKRRRPCVDVVHSPSVVWWRLRRNELHPVANRRGDLPRLRSRQIRLDEDDHPRWRA